MKPASIIIILVGSMLLVPAAVGQTSPKTIPRPPSAPLNVSPNSPQSINLSGIWRFRGRDGKTYTVRFEQHGDNLKEFAPAQNNAQKDLLLFEGRLTPTGVVGKRLTFDSANSPKWLDDTLIVNNPERVHFENGPLTVRVSPEQLRAEQLQAQLQKMMGIAIAAMASDGPSGSGSSQSASVSDQSDQAEEARRQQRNDEEEAERQRRNQCEMRGGTVSSGIFSGSTCQ